MRKSAQEVAFGIAIFVFPHLSDRQSPDECSGREENSFCLTMSLVANIEKYTDVRGSVHHSLIHEEKSNKMQKCIKTLLLPIYMKLNMFRATHRPSSGA